MLLKGHIFSPLKCQQKSLGGQFWTVKQSNGWRVNTLSFPSMTLKQNAAVQVRNLYFVNKKDTWSQIIPILPEHGGGIRQGDKACLRQLPKFMTEACFSQGLHCSDIYLSLLHRLLIQAASEVKSIQLTSIKKRVQWCSDFRESWIFPFKNLAGLVILYNYCIKSQNASTNWLRADQEANMLLYIRIHP